MRLQKGARVGPYEIVSLLGAGGMGEVYRAHDARLDRDVAIKTLLHAGGERAAERFAREARALATINHPNVCQIYEIGEESGLPFIAMELLEGESLASRLVRSRPSPAESLDIVLAVLFALQTLHAKNLVHRDIKPSNVFLAAHGVKLLDFGLARSTDRPSAATATGLTMAGTILGTPRYMSPEQIQGRAVDARTDLFALGVMLFEMLAGMHPFPGESEAALFHAIVAEPPRTLLGPPWADALDRVLRKTLAKRPDDRHRSADAMAGELRAVRPMVDSSAALDARPTSRLAVLPFRVLRDDPELAFVAAGITDAVTAALSRVETIVMRSALAARPDADMKTLGRELDVDALLTGTLIGAGGRLRTTVQLVASADGKVLWSQAFTGTLTEQPKFEAELVAAALTGLHVSGIAPRAGDRGDGVFRIESLAVLPLENLSGDAAQEYLADGMTDALITDLARLHGLKRVIARSSVMRYKRTDKPPADIARELRVDALVTGAVVRAGDRVRITAQLVDGSTEEQIWADRYERDLRDVLALQNDVLRDIAGQIKVQLTGGEAARLADARSVNPDAYEACLKGEFHCDRLAPDSLRIALEYFKQALQMDPNYARAHAGIARAWGSRAHMGLVPYRDVPPEARTGHRTAMSIDPSLIDAHVGLASWLLYFDWEWIAAERALQRGFEVNPNYAKLHQLGADIYLILGRTDDALAALERSVELDPLDFWLQAAVGGRLLRVGKWDEGVAQLRKALGGDATLSLAHQYLWTAFHHRGMFDEAVEPAKTFLSLRGQHEAADALSRGLQEGGYARAMRLAADAMAARAAQQFVQPTQIAALYAHAGEQDLALQWLDRAYDGRDSWMVFLKDDPRFDALRGNRGFQALLGRMNFP